jgi:kynurenine formamidase
VWGPDSMQIRSTPGKTGAPPMSEHGAPGPRQATGPANDGPAAENRPAGKRRSDNWGRWGTDDEIGALNLLTPRLVRDAAHALRSGRAYDLGIPIQPEGVPLLDFRGRPMRLTLQDPTDEKFFSDLGCAAGTGANEDVLVMASHTTSHMDALIHVYENSQYYNGTPTSAMRAMTGAEKLGIEKVRGFAARAVLLDMPRHFGDGPWLEPGRSLSGRDLEIACDGQGIEVRAGDVVLVRTGYLQMWLEQKTKQVGFLQPGLSKNAAQWLADRDVVAVGSDNTAVEVLPFDEDDFFAVHKLLLVRHGIYMLELLDLSAPAEDDCFEGLIAVAPLKVTGATGSPVNPILIG